MLDKSIDGALLALRKQIIRGNLDGLEHVEALLVLRGVDMPAVLPARRDNVAPRGHMRRWVVAALRDDGPQPYSAIAERIVAKRPDLTLEDVRDRLGQCLWKMRKAGLIDRDFGSDGCLWSLVAR